MEPVASENCPNTKKHKTHTKLSAIYANQIFEEKKWKKKIRLVNHPDQNHFFNWVFQGRKPERCFEGNRLWLSETKHANIQFMANLIIQVSVPKNRMHCLAIKYSFRIRKKSTDALMDEMQPEARTTKGLILRKIKTFYNFWLLRSVHFPT